MDCKLCNFQSIPGSTKGFTRDFLQWRLRHSEKAKGIPGYFYIELLRHETNPSLLTKTEFSELADILRETTSWVMQNLTPAKIYTVTIAEAVPHIHYHLVPRYCPEPKGMDYLSLALSGGRDFLEFAPQNSEEILNKYFNGGEWT